MTQVFFSDDIERDPAPLQEGLDKARRLLGHRRYEIAMMRFGYLLTQQEIAGCLGISQASVSRELKAIERLSALHAGLQSPSNN